MYERIFDTDWETIDDREEVLRRAFALGASEWLDEPNPDELERLTNAVETAYERRFVELAYQKGEQHVRQLEARADDSAQVRRYLADELTEIDPLGRDADSESDSEDATDEDVESNGLPSSLQGFRIDTLPDDSTERVRRPDVLDRDER